MGLLGCESHGHKPPHAKQQAQIRVVHASWDAPAVDVYIQGQSTPLFQNLNYGDASGYKTLNTGTYVLEIRATGSSSSSTPLYTASAITLNKGDIYTFILGGSVDATSPDEAFRLVPVQETWSAPSSGYARLRFVHVSSNAPTVAVDVSDDGVADISGLGRFQSSGSGGLLVSSGQKLQVSLRTSSERLTGFTLPALDSGDRVLVIVVGDADEVPRLSTSLSLLVVGRSRNYGFVRQNPVVYFLHASPDAGSMDLWLGSRRVAEDLMFGELSAPLQLAPGSYSVGAYPHSSSSTPPGSGLLINLGLNGLAAGERYLAVGMGFEDGSGSMALTWQVYREGFALDDPAVRLRAIHAVPDAPTVDVGYVNMGVVTAIPGLTDLSFRMSSDPLGASVAVGSYELGIAAHGTTAMIHSFNPTFSAGERDFGVIAGALYPQGYDMALNLIVVDTVPRPWTVRVYEDD